LSVSKIRVFQTIADGSPLGFDVHLVLGWNMLDFSADCGISRFTRDFCCAYGT
jgi:hypothetical protein